MLLSGDQLKQQLISASLCFLTREAFAKHSNFLQRPYLFTILWVLYIPDFYISTLVRLTHGQHPGWFNVKSSSVGTLLLSILCPGSKSSFVIYIFRTPMHLVVTLPSGMPLTQFTWHFCCFFVYLRTQVYILFWNPRNLSDPSKVKYLTGIAIMTRYDRMGKVIHWESCKKLKFDHTAMWYMHKPKSAIENETRTTDKWQKIENMSSCECLPSRQITKRKMIENEKREKYVDLARELKKLWKMWVTVIPVVIFTPLQCLLFFYYDIM